MTDVKITCQAMDCAVKPNTADKRFCAEISKEIGGEDFKACVSIEGDSVVRGYGGSLIDNTAGGNICYKTEDEGTPPTSKEKVMPGPVSCANATACGTVPSPNPNNISYACKAWVEMGSVRLQEFAHNY